MALAGRHSDWVVGFEDEVWWSRLAQPHLRTWSESALRVVAKSRPKGDLEPKALACYGLLRADTDEMLLRFVDGRPVSGVTTEFLRWVCGRLAKARKRVFVLVWDNAAWHVSAAVRSWIRKHNREVKRTGKGVRILECRLPSKSPWLNSIEPKWMHGKRAIVEPTRTLTSEEVESHVCSYYRCPRTKRLQQHVS
jgi:transposase